MPRSTCSRPYLARLGRTPPLCGVLGWLALVPVRPGPDEVQACLTVHLGQCGVDWSGKARVIQLDREVVAVALVGALLPCRTELNIACIDAVVRALVGGVVNAGNAGLDVECEGADRAGKAVFGGGEDADGSHCL